MKETEWKQRYNCSNKLINWKNRRKCINERIKHSKANNVMMKLKKIIEMEWNLEEN